MNGNLIKLKHADCRKAMEDMDAASVDSIVTDPPYGLSFMGKEWDHGVPGQVFWDSALRVAKPGAHLLAFGGTRTYHRLVCAIEDAGWEIRDTIAWVYGCVDQKTEIFVEGEWKQFGDFSEGDRVLSFNPETDEYEWHPIQEIVAYEYADTAYRIRGDHTDQLVSKDHRVIVEHDGDWVFQRAQHLPREQEIRVPTLENLPDVPGSIPVYDERTGAAQPVLQHGVCWEEDSGDTSSECSATQGSGWNGARELFGMRGNILESTKPRGKGRESCMQLRMQRGLEGQRLEKARPQRPLGVERGGRATLSSAHDGQNQPVVEGWRYLQASQRELQERNHGSVSTEVQGHGAVKWLRSRAQAEGSTGAGSSAVENGGGSSCRSRQPQQRFSEPRSFQKQQGSQAVRASRQTRSSLARVETCKYRGTMWCIKVPTGAFIARRNGQIFCTGNSGFPKSHDVSKAIDKAAGVEREVVGRAVSQGGRSGSTSSVGQHLINAGKEHDITAPATEAAKQWDGWGTALKPALEPICVARKPFSGTVAENVLEHRTGALNVDGCRVEIDPSDRWAQGVTFVNSTEWQPGSLPTRGDIDAKCHHAGRWPANLIHDGSDEATKGMGEAARFFYCAKASKADRGFFNDHPTVKPTDLMRYLCRLVTPPGGLVLDPFLGSGSTGKAAVQEGFRFVGIEKDAHSIDIARRRIFGQTIGLQL